MEKTELFLGQMTYQMKETQVHSGSTFIILEANGTIVGEFQGPPVNTSAVAAFFGLGYNEHSVYLKLYPCLPIFIFIFI